MEELHKPFWPAHRPRHLTLPDTSLWFNLEVSAARFPRKTCTIFYDAQLTFAELKRDAERLAGFLQRECGVRRGDRVALYMQNSPQFIIAYYAILRADAMVVPINPMNRALELAAIVEDSGAQVMIAPQDLFANVEPLIGKAIEHAIVACYSDYLAAQSDLEIPEPLAVPRQVLRASGVTMWQDALALGIQPGPHLSTADDLCVMPYTSGTTGQPKGCVHRHRSVMHTVVAVVTWHDSHHEDRGLSVLPMFHVTGMQHCMNVGIYLGSSGVIMSRWNREMAGKLIERYRCTRWTSVPTMLIDFLASPTTPSYDDGYYFFVDRIKRMINASGFKVWPAEVESLLFAHPAVQEAVVIAAKDAKRGETVKALIVLKPAARGQQTPEQIIEWAKANMAAYKVPRVVELVDSLPKSPSGKVLWRVLQEREDRA
jgi:fatty-acyl-CoA synthase